MLNFDRRTFLKNTALATTSFALTGCQTEGESVVSSQKSSKRPNLVFVFPDQFRVQALGFMKQDPVITPNLDRFAVESRYFTNAVSNRPLCSPYRGMLLTGRWPHSTGITTNCNSSVPNNYLRQSECTLTDVLADNDYSVGYIGKWHLDTPQGVPRAPHWRGSVWDSYTPPGPQRHGVDFWYSYGTDSRHLEPHYWIGDASEDEKTVVDEYSPEHESKVAVEYIKNTGGKYRNKNKPFTLFVAMNPPHPRYQDVPDKYREYYKGKTPDELLNRGNVEKGHEKSRKNVADYFAAVTAVDMAFGKILQALDEAGLKENTIVVFSADHGEMMGSHGRMQKVVPYEESFRIPLIIRWPGKIPTGPDDLHINVPDYMPTLLSLVGLKEHIPSQVEGTDCSAALLGGEMTRPESTFYLCDTDLHDKDIDVKRGVRTGRYTFVVELLEDGSFEKILYDNHNDPYQMTSVADENPEIVARLSMELKNWLTKTRDPYTEKFLKVIA